MTEILLGKQIGSGATANVYECGQGKVCKLYEPNADNAEFEYRKMKEAYDLGLPVPRPFELIEINNRHGIIMEQICGTSLMEILMKHLVFCFENRMTHHEIFISDVIQGMIRTVAATLADFHSHTCNLQETDKISLSTGCQYNTYLSNAEKEKVYDLIARLPDGDSLIHGDPNPGNFIVQNGSVRVIDWNDCVRGNYMYDIAEYVLIMRYATVSIDLPEPILHFITEYQAEFSKVFMTEYTRLTNRNLSTLEQWTLPLLVSKLNANNPPKKQERILADVKTLLRAL